MIYPNFLKSYQSSIFNPAILAGFFNPQITQITQISVSYWVKFFLQKILAIFFIYFYMNDRAVILQIFYASRLANTATSTRKIYEIRIYIKLKNKIT